jgi:pyruvate kinase
VRKKSKFLNNAFRDVLNNNYLPNDLIPLLLSRYDHILDKCCYVYLGDQLEDIQQISKINIRFPCFVFSDDYNFLSNCQLYYSVFPILVNKVHERNIK